MTLEQIMEARPSKEWDARFASESKSPTTGNTVQRVYTRFYAAINEDLNGRPEQAKKFMRMAAESEWSKKATGGPGYMAQVARLLLEAMESAPPAEPPVAEEKKEEKK